MAFQSILRLYIVILAAFLAIDLTWLGVVARPFYRAQMDSLMAPRVNWLAAALFYVIFTSALLVFVVLPGVRAGSLFRTLVLGAFFGLVTYAAYDLTNLATLNNWPLLLALVDMVWGMVLTAVTSWIGFMVGRNLV